MSALNIRNAEAHRLAREIAELTGESFTGAAVTALCARKAALDASRGPDREKLARWLEAGRAYRARLEAAGLPIPSSMNDDDLYDEWGLPR